MSQVVTIVNATENTMGLQLVEEMEDEEIWDSESMKILDNVSELDKTSTHLSGMAAGFGTSLLMMIGVLFIGLFSFEEVSLWLCVCS